MTRFGHLPAGLRVRESDVFVSVVTPNPAAALRECPRFRGWSRRSRGFRSCVWTSCVRFVCSPPLWSTLMCDTDQQCQSPAAVMPVPPKARKTPHISHITSLKSFILLSVLCDLTQWLFMPRDPAHVCARPCTFVRSRSGQIRPLLQDNTPISVLHTHLCLSFLSCPLLSFFRKVKRRNHCRFYFFWGGVAHFVISRRKLLGRQRRQRGLLASVTARTHGWYRRR